MRGKTVSEMRQELMELGMYRLLNHYEGDIEACVECVRSQSGPEDPILAFAQDDPEVWWGAHKRTLERIRALEARLKEQF